MIREAVLSDISQLLVMSAQFHAESSHKGMVAFDHESMRVTLENLITSEAGVIFIDDQYQGMIGLILSPSYFNFAHINAHEAFWWVDSKARGHGVGGDLLMAAEQWAFDHGANVVAMVAIESSGEMVRQFYQNSGYEHSETIHTKVLQ